jgi:signal transduction histidine kinase
VGTSLKSFVNAFRHSLSGRVFLLTVLFVFVAELFLWIPSIARFHQDRLGLRLSAAQIAVLALDQIPAGDLRPELKRELLANAEVRAVALKRNQTRQLFLAEPIPPSDIVTFETRDAGMFTTLSQALSTLWGGQGRVMRILGEPRFEGGEFIEVVADEAPLRAEMLIYTERIAWLSIVIALITAVPIFVALRYFLVLPMRRLTSSMTAFQQNPEDAGRIMVPSLGRSEMAEAERSLAAMQGDVRKSLQQRAHLAELGLAVAKIQHDLRNILTTAQLTTDRLASSQDPKVQQLAPRLVQSIDRAIALANNTLKYGRADESPPNRARIALAPIMDEVSAGALAAGQGRVVWRSDLPPDFHLDADAEQLVRILLNVARNAVEALEANGGGEVRVTAANGADSAMIDIADNGPGIPSKAQGALFQPFASQGKSGGSGLGLTIARELARGHGGDLTLLETGPSGTTFRLALPLQTAQ